MRQALLVATDTEELASLALVMQRVGLTVLRSVDLDTALEKWGAAPLDVIVLSYDGRPPAEQIRRLRGLTDVPLVLLVDALPEAMHVSLLDSGVDMVLVRPMSSRLLRASLQALLRRVAGMPITMLPSLTVESVTLEPTARTVQVGNESPKRLTNLEFRLLYTLMMHHGQVLSTAQLVERVWGYAGDKDRELARGLVRRLRSKIENDPRQPRLLITVSGVGYAFMPDGDEICQV